jgi:hypothetical protein
MANSVLKCKQNKKIPHMYVLEKTKLYFDCGVTTTFFFFFFFKTTSGMQLTKAKNQGIKILCIYFDQLSGILLSHLRLLR